MHLWWHDATTASLLQCCGQAKKHPCCFESCIQGVLGWSLQCTTILVLRCSLVGCLLWLLQMLPCSKGKPKLKIIVAVFYRSDAVSIAQPKSQSTDCSALFEPYLPSYVLFSTIVAYVRYRMFCMEWERTCLPVHRLSLVDISAYSTS